MNIQHVRPKGDLRDSAIRNRAPEAGVLAELAAAGFLPALRVLRPDDSKAQDSDSVISSSSSNWKFGK